MIAPIPCGHHLTGGFRRKLSRTIIRQRHIFLYELRISARIFQKQNSHVSINSNAYPRYFHKYLSEITSGNFNNITRRYRIVHSGL